jgi:hypothetical protein
LAETDPGSIGVYVDDAEKSAVIVADPSDVGALERLTAEAASISDGFPVRVTSGCYPKADLVAVQATLSSYPAELAGSQYVSMIDAALSRVVVYIDSAEGADTLRSRFGDLVAVDVVPRVSPLVNSRYWDSTPHYGDAQIQNCSTNFAYNNFLGAAVMVTAGHCGANGFNYYSGGHLVGTASSVVISGPDLGLVWASGQYYTNVIYTDPGAPTLRHVVGKINPGIGTFLCPNGSYSLAQCGADVYNTSASFCTTNGCTAGMWARRAQANGVICRPGDSGGTVYQQSGSSNALAAGMITGGISDTAGNPVPVYGFHVCFFQTVSSIESHYGLTIRTSP